MDGFLNVVFYISYSVVSLAKRQTFLEYIDHSVGGLANSCTSADGVSVRITWKTGSWVRCYYFHICFLTFQKVLFGHLQVRCWRPVRKKNQRKRRNLRRKKRKRSKTHRAFAELKHMFITCRANLFLLWSFFLRCSEATGSGWWHQNNRGACSAVDRDYQKYMDFKKFMDQYKSYEDGGFQQQIVFFSTTWPGLVEVHRWEEWR